MKENIKAAEFVSKRREPGKREDANRPQKLIRRSAVCAALAMGLLCLSAMDTEFTDTISNGLKKAATSEMVLDEDLGRIHFVDTGLPVSDGAVVTTFSESGREVSLSGEDSAAVMAVLPGTVAVTGDDVIVVSNDNGTRSTYTGVRPTVAAGERVREDQVIGRLAEEVLALETVGATGYVDSLDEKELTETMD